MSFANRALVATATIGTGTITLGAAQAGYQSLAEAGVTDGETVSYTIEEGSNFEIGRGVYSSGAQTLTRAAIIRSKIAGSSADTSPLSLSGNARVFLTVVAEDLLTSDDLTPLIRNEQLTASRTYYVRSDGSNSNTGLANTAGGAWLTIQYAVSTIRQTVDQAGYTVTIQVADGSYSAGATVTGNGTGPLVIQGNTTTPANVVVTATSANGFVAADGAVITVKGFKVVTVTAGSCFYAVYGGVIRFDKMDFGACAASHITASDHGEVTATLSSSYTISGGAVSHAHAFNEGNVILAFNTITLTGTPAFSSYFCGVAIGSANFESSTFVGSATGVRFLCHKNGTIDTNFGGPNFLPGNAAGTLASGGQVPETNSAYTQGSTAGNPVVRGVTGSDTNIDVVLSAKGSGVIRAAATLVPNVSDGSALGSSSLMWSDLSLASGGEINWNNGTLRLTQSGASLQMSGTNATFQVLGTGNSGLEIGRVDGTSSTPFIDLHSGATAVDYDVRLIASGGTGSNGGGTLDAQVGTFSINAVPVFTNIPQNSRSAAYTTVLADAQKHIFHPAADNNARTFTIDSNANVPYPIGTAITFVNQINTVTIAITSDTLTLMGAGTTGSRTLAANGIATAMKVTSTSWVISGTNLT